MPQAPRFHLADIGSSAIVAYAAFLHLGWGLNLVLFGPASRDVTGVHGLALLVPGGYLGPLLLIIAALAGLSLVGSSHRQWSLALIPQQAALVLSALSAAEAILAGQFADGVPRPATFIFADQFPYLLLPIFHTFAILRFAGGQWTPHLAWHSPPLP